MEDDLHELPFWRVANFSWLIAWGGEVQMGIMSPNLYQPSCFKRIFKQSIVASMDVLLSHNVSYLDSLHTWDGKHGDILMMQHLDLWRISSYEVVLGEKRVLFSPILAVA